jgi:dTDP-4-amino-4,6-dideoxygalactose transaminase
MVKVPLLDLKIQYEELAEEIKEAVEEVCGSGQFILGPFVEKFEKEIANWCQVRSAVGVASGTDALLLSLEAIGIRPGDEVITTPYTFFSTVSVIHRLKAKPVFVDIDPRTYNLNPDPLEKVITPRTRAIIPVHLYGQCARMDKILSLAKAAKIEVIEDAAQAFGAKYKEKAAGTMGTLGCFSFFPTKNLGGYGDGGMIVTDSEELAEKIRTLRVHGSQDRCFHSLVGYNSRLDALQAAILSVKLKYFPKWQERRRKNAHLYHQLLKDLPLTLPYVEEDNFHTYHQYVIRTEKRDELRSYLKEREISTEIYYLLPLHLQECFRYLGYQRGDFPEAEKAAKETLALPIYPELKKEEQEEVALQIRNFFATL